MPINKHFPGGPKGTPLQKPTAGAYIKMDSRGPLVPADYAGPIPPEVAAAAEEEADEFSEQIAHEIKRSFAALAKVEINPTQPKEGDEELRKSYPDRIIAECNRIKALLLRRNQEYSDGMGFTAMRVFTDASTEDRILSRLDDKVSRIASDGPKNEHIEDVAGYCLLLLAERAE